MTFIIGLDHQKCDRITITYRDEKGFFFFHRVLRGNQVASRDSTESCQTLDTQIPFFLLSRTLGLKELSNLYNLEILSRLQKGDNLLCKHKFVLKCEIFKGI